jgi:hypothetical protein
VPAGHHLLDCLQTYPCCCSSSQSRSCGAVNAPHSSIKFIHRCAQLWREVYYGAPPAHLFSLHVCTSTFPCNTTANFSHLLHCFSNQPFDCQSAHSRNEVPYSLDLALYWCQSVPQSLLCRTAEQAQIIGTQDPDQPSFSQHTVTAHGRPRTDTDTVCATGARLC